MRNVSRLLLRAHTLKVEAAGWLKDGSRVCDQCLGEVEHVQNEVHAFFFFFFWLGLLHGPQQGPDRMKEKTYKTGKRKTPA